MERYSNGPKKKTDELGDVAIDLTNKLKNRRRSTKIGGQLFNVKKLEDLETTPVSSCTTMSSSFLKSEIDQEEENEKKNNPLETYLR